jgi:cysteine desulfurase family protein (TIGR01976 family)
MSTTRAAEMDLGYVRAHFPALSDEWALFDNAGGSVPLWGVIDRVRDYMRSWQVNLGASYAQSAHASELVAEGARAMATLVHADPEEIVLGGSSTLLLRLLASALAPRFAPGDEIVVTDLDHESNIGPWRALEEKGVVIREWTMDRATGELTMEGLERVLGPRTKLVAFVQVSNLVGTIQDAAAFVRRIHEAGAMACVDTVAFAPHRRLDVQALGADFCFVSIYKLSGPHLALLHARRDRLRETKSLNHFFFGQDLGPYRLQPGGVNHELTASLPAVLEYYVELGKHLGAAPGAELDHAFEAIAAYEARLARPLLEFLAQRKGVRLLGLADADPARRVPTISFTVEGRDSEEIVRRLDAAKVATRFGHFYSYRAADALGLLRHNGVVRVSMVHSNTEAEVTRLIAALDGAI